MLLLPSGRRIKKEQLSFCVIIIISSSNTNTNTIETRAERTAPNEGGK
jgi:hypothetical protein